jgi:hypothetical protein
MEGKPGGRLLKLHAVEKNSDLSSKNNIFNGFIYNEDILQTVNYNGYVNIYTTDIFTTDIYIQQKNQYNVQ